MMLEMIFIMCMKKYHVIVKVIAVKYFSAGLCLWLCSLFLPADKQADNNLLVEVYFTILGPFLMDQNSNMNKNWSNIFKI